MGVIAPAPAGRRIATLAGAFRQARPIARAQDIRLAAVTVITYRAKPAVPQLSRMFHG